MNARYVIRADRTGHTIHDLTTGEAAVIAMTPQTGLRLEDAIHTAELLNERSAAAAAPSAPALAAGAGKA